VTTASEISTLLDRLDDLTQKLKEEPWSEYDPTLQRALLSLMKVGFSSLQKVAKAISQVTPSQTRSSGAPNGEPWFEHILDEMK
jgi:hypothetical protein